MSIIKIFDNLANNFSMVGNNYLLGASIPGYNSLNSTHVGSRVSYLARNFLPNEDIEFESGIGIVTIDGSTIIVQRQSIVSSSNNDNSVSFSTAGTKILYIVPNELNNKNSFNNLVNVSGLFNISDYKASYIIDLNNIDSSGLLPPSTPENAGLIIELKTINPNHPLTILPSGSQTIDELNSLTISTLNFKRILSNGSGWTTLEQPLVVQTGSPAGDTYSLQYHDGNGGFGGSSILTDNNNNLYIDNNHTIRVSGTTEFNKNSLNNNFIVRGKPGKNLFFDADGKLGINMPSGYLPQVPLHILQTACAESIRVENRQVSNSAILTLYHKPSVVPSQGDIPSKINLSGKNSASNQVNYASIKAKILNANSGSTLGAFVVDIDSDGSDMNLIDLSKFYSKIGPDNILSGNHIVFGKNNTIQGNNNVVVGDNVTYSGSDSVVVGRGENRILVSNNEINLESNNTSILNMMDSNIGIGKNPTQRLDVNGDILASGLTTEILKLTSSHPSGQIPLINDNTFYISKYNINNIIVGNNSGLLIKNGDVEASGLSNIYLNNDGLNIESNILFPNINNNYALSIQNSFLSNYSGLALNDNDIVINKPIKINTNNTYTINGQSPDLYSEKHIVTSGLVIDPNGIATSGSVLVNMGGGVSSWKDLNAYDLVFNGLDISWNKYPRRNSIINSSIQITITDTANTEEFIVNDVVEVIQNDTAYYTTILNKTTVGTNIVLIVNSMPISSGSASVLSSSRGGYLTTAVPSGLTTNLFSIRPEKDTVFNTGKANINYGIYGSATNYALYINANYTDNTLDESQIVVNGSVPYNISGTRYATMTINGYLYTSDLKVSGDVDMDCGVIVFSGAA